MVFCVTSAVDPVTSGLYTLQRVDAQSIGNGIVLVDAVSYSTSTRARQGK